MPPYSSFLQKLAPGERSASQVSSENLAKSAKFNRYLQMYTQISRDLKKAFSEDAQISVNF